MEIKSYEISSDNLDDVISKVTDLLKENLKEDREENYESEFDRLGASLPRLVNCLIESLEDDINYGFKIEGFKVKADLLLGLLGWGKNSNT